MQRQYQIPIHILYILYFLNCQIKLDSLSYSEKLDMVFDSLGIF